ncbi:AraC family transcriptional regulator [Vibrio toranzoniae]|uniref:AraC family transcriptional regulator n=1 Tax=Vibrio toranzoniae TaxID=1194427 RepID=A0A109D5F5_9VIBR|nr:helix-turn-helix domain-containing protein [Vibrio toranzoniae]KWT99232.1 AraC family transcriptional regulator [Vibrio toranzoniae]SBS39199.1 HTH-type transcriptional activator Btr [Vibrio toranzoniae]
MLAIPVPFIVSMLLGLLAIILYARLSQQTKVASMFLGLCSATTAMVGLRWTFGLEIFSIAQPILASTIPVAAWYAFAHANRDLGFLPIKHFVAPLLVVVSSITQPWLALPLDEILTLTYIIYGIALLRFSSTEAALINVSLGNWEGVKKAESIAGWVLIFSAFVDTFMSLDLTFNQGELSLYILTAAHLVLLPVLSIAVVVTGINTPITNGEKSKEMNGANDEPLSSALMTSERAEEITSMLDSKICQDSLYLDPELTLSKLTRKLGIPAKQISIAVNQVHKKNISKLINKYRIDHAKHALITSQDTITQVFMNSGFQTKSNFNREFSTMTGMTPSEYRKSKEKHNK